MGHVVCKPRNRSVDYGRPDLKIVDYDTDLKTDSATIAVTVDTIREQVAISTSIDNILKKEKSEDKRRVKILLLGGADAGKSTILKQMRILHMTGFSEHEMRNFHMNLRYNVFQIFYEISLGIQESLGPIADEEKSMVYRFSEGSSLFTSSDEVNDAKLLLQFLELKCVKSFMALYPNYSSLPDNAHYYLPKLSSLLSPDHVPTAEDILHLRIPTTSVNEINFTFSSSSIRLIDVGGQRTYRKKWIHCFDGVAAVLFVVSMAAYDQSLDEAELTIKPVLHDEILPLADPAKTLMPNRLRDSFQLFGEMLRNDFLSSSSFILFLNKMDLFEKKLPNQPLNKFFKLYNGKSTQDASEFIKEHFHKRKSRKDKRAIYSHYTCATDTKNVEFVFKAACDIVLQKNLHSQGM